MEQVQLQAQLPPSQLHVLGHSSNKRPRPPVPGALPGSGGCRRAASALHRVRLVPLFLDHALPHDPLLHLLSG